MDAQKIHEVVVLYQRKLQEKGVEPEQFSVYAVNPSPVEVRQHVLWMLNQIPGFLDEEKLGKSKRWIAAATSALWAIGDEPIADAMKAFKPKGEKFREGA